MDHYLHRQYLETKAKFEKFSSRLQKSQDKGGFYRMSKRKQNYLVNRIRKLWEKLRLLEVRLKITTAGAALALMLMVSNLNAQEFQAAPDKNPLPPPTVFGFDPYLVDIDNDGDLDLIVNDYWYTKLFLNTGTAENPHFEAIPADEDPIRALENTEFGLYNLVGAADLDGDNDIDLLSRDGMIYRNIGSNSNISFYEQRLFDYLPYDGALGDFDGDNDIDLVAPGYAEASLNIYENVGNAANFQLNIETPIAYPISNWDEAILDVDNMYVADLDNDGDLDILMGVDMRDLYDNWSEGIKYVENTGTSVLPAFSLLPDANHPFSILERDELSLGDLDNDGDYDLVFTDYYQGGGIQFLEMQAEGLVKNTALVPEFSDGVVLPMSYYFSPQFVDYDGDGDLDLFTWSYYSDNGGTIYYENTGNSSEANFVRKEDRSFGFVDLDIYAQAPFFADLDGDGDIDVVRLTYDYDYLTETEILEYVYLENTGTDANPVYFNHGRLGILGEDDDIIRPSFVDIDNDGDMDMFFISDARVSEYEYSKITRYFELTSLEPVTYVERKGSANPLALLNEDNFNDITDYAMPVFTDLDKDGDFDVVFTGYYGLYYLENTGSESEASFVDRTASSSLPSFTYLTEGTAINLVDIDADGDDDLLVHQEYGMITSFYENTGISSGTAAIDESKAASLTAYPNPVSDLLFIDLPEEANELKYNVMSMDGRVIETSLSRLGKGDKLVLQTENYDPGYYIIRIESGGNNYRLTFIKN